MVTIISSQPFVQDNLDEPVRGNDQKATHTINIPSENTMGDLIEIRQFLVETLVFHLIFH